MHAHRRSAIVVTGAGLTLAAWAVGLATAGAAAEAQPSAPPASLPDTQCTPSESAAPMSSPPGSAAELPSWQTLPITDVDGVTFALADCIGTPVLVELFATWCHNCAEQLPATDAAAEALGDGAVVLALSVETDLSPDDVAAYRHDRGFTNIRFAVLTPEHLAAFVEAFGNTAANPPSTPKIVIDAMGIAGEMRTGEESAEELIEQLTAAGAIAAPVTTG